MIYIFDKDEILLTVLRPDGPCPYREAAHLEQINGEHNFTFWVPADHSDSQYVKEENMVAFKDEDGDIRLFVIKELDEVHDGMLYKEAFCQAAWIDELSEEPIEDIRPQDKTANEALTSALQNTRWQVGTVAELGLNSTNFYYENVVSAIKKIINAWGGEIKDRIVVTEGKITGRYIDILDRRGADTGKQFEITKDIQSLKRTVLSYPKTALYGRGKGLETETGGYSRKITFADVVWSKANGDPVDKPAGQEWVGDPDALAQFGRLNSDGTRRHRFGFFDSSDEEDQVKLLQNTWDDLQVKKNPIVRYELSIIDLEKVPGFEHEKTRLGDTGICIDRLFSPAILVEARVIERKRYLNEPERTEIKLGNFIDNILDYNKKLENIEATINDRKGVWDSGGGPVTDASVENIIPAAPVNVAAAPLFKKVLLTWTFESALYIAAYEVYGSQVAGFAPDSSNLLWRGKSSAFAHEPGVNQLWYYRVRAVNTHGVAGPYSEQVSAQTIQIEAEDIAPLTITDTLIAEDALIDSAKIGDIDAAKITTGTLKAIAIEGVSITGATFHSDKDYQGAYYYTMEDTDISGSTITMKTTYSNHPRGENKRIEVLPDRFQISRFETNRPAAITKVTEGMVELWQYDTSIMGAVQTYMKMYTDSAGAYVYSDSDVLYTAPKSTFNHAIYASSFNPTSRKKYKTNIKELDFTVLDKVLSTKVYNYDLKSELEKGSEYANKIGLIYEEVPNELHGGEDSIDLYSMTSILWKAVQELSAKVDSLEKELKKQ